MSALVSFRVRREQLRPDTRLLAWSLPLPVLHPSSFRIRVHPHSRDLTSSLIHAVMPVDIQALAISNDTFSDEYLGDLRNRRREVQEELEAIQRHPSGPGLSGKRKHLLSRLSTFNTILAPHRLLPPELLAQIFIAVYPEASFIPTQRRSSPLTLCQVCSKWRNVALATPELWTDVILRLSRYSPVDPGAAIDATLQWFQRARDGPVSLVVWNQLRPTGEPSKLKTCPANLALQRVVNELLEPLGRRFRKLELKGFPHHTLFDFLRTPGSFPELHRAAFILPNFWLLQGADPVGKPDVLSSSHSPRLCDIELAGFDPGHVVDFHLPWASLTRLTLLLIPFSVSQSFDLLKKSRRLEECQLLVHDSPLSALHAPFLPDSLIHTSLRKLTIEFDSPYRIGAWFGRIVASSLRVLSITCCTDFQMLPSSTAVDWAFDEFMTFLGQSSFPLEVLHTDIPFTTQPHIKTTPPQVVSIAQALPTLTELRLPESPPRRDGTLPAQLLRMVGRGEVLPKLKVLVGQVTSIGDLVDMLERRWEESLNEGGEGTVLPVSALEFVMVDHLGRITVEQAGRVDKLRAKGIEILANKSEREPDI